MPAGDSITDGIAADNGYQSKGGYRVELFKRAVEGGFDINFVGTAGQNGPATVAGKTFPKAHEGVSSEKINQLNGRIPGNGPAQGNPNIILVHIGTNDINANAATPEKDLEKLIDKLLDNNPTSLIVVASLVPNALNSTSQPNTDKFNAKIPAIVESRADLGMNIIFVDMAAKFPAGGLSTDKLHPKQAGYDAMGDIWFDAIKQYLGGGASTGGTTALNGNDLFQKNCSSCHSKSAVAGKTAATIRNKINTVNSMKGLSGLTDAQLEAIAKVL